MGRLPATGHGEFTVAISRQIATAVEMRESTVCRVTTKKANRDVGGWVCQPTHFFGRHLSIS
jgi:DNA-directed RNA polymerase specialized sigma54-like protein